MNLPPPTHHCCDLPALGPDWDIVMFIKFPSLLIPSRPAILFLCLWFLLPTLIAQNSDSKILLQNVQVLTFQLGEYTTARRSKPLPQIQCNSGCNQYIPSQIQCQNSENILTNLYLKPYLV